jgi:hypothetical protein
MPHDFYEKFLKSFPSDIAVAEHESPLFLASLPELSQAFQKVTGYHLRFAKPGHCLPECMTAFPIQSGGKDQAYTMGVVRSLTSVSLIPDRDVESLARALADMISEAHQWQVALRQREAELAANVQLTFHEPKTHGLAQLLEHILRSGAKAIQCDAAALYLLDHETSLLKIRSVWGLPEERLTDPPRQLCTALADLEAMLGHAVVLNEETLLTERWNPPENFTSSVCVPIASSTSIHGTLWFYADSYVDFDAKALNLLEIVAGRLAAELERTTLLREGHDCMILKNQLTDAEHFLQSMLPRASAPQGEQWQVAGTASHCKPLAATFYDWQNLSGNKLLITLVSTAERMPSVEAQMRMVMLQTEIKNLGHYNHSAKQILHEIEDIAFSQQAEGKPFEMMYALLDKGKSQLQISCSGSFILFRGPCREKSADGQPVVERIDHDFEDARPELGGFRMLRLSPGESLIAIQLPRDTHSLNERIISALFSKTFQQETLLPVLNANAAQISERLATHIQETISGTNVTVVTIKNNASQ